MHLGDGGDGGGGWAESRGCQSPPIHQACSSRNSALGGNSPGSGKTTKKCLRWSAGSLPLSQCAAHREDSPVPLLPRGAGGGGVWPWSLASRPAPSVRTQKLGDRHQVGLLSFLGSQSPEAWAERSRHSPQEGRAGPFSQLVPPYPPPGPQPRWCGNRDKKRLFFLGRAGGPA